MSCVMSPHESLLLLPRIHWSGGFRACAFVLIFLGTLGGVLNADATPLQQFAVSADRLAVVGWGNNGDGQTSIPAAAQGGLTAIAAGHSHSLALKSDGSVVGWGYNGNGETSIPEVALAEVSGLAAGAYHSLALKSDGSVVGWGYNGNGETSIPEAASSGATAIAAGYFHSLALKSDGLVLGWGYNGYGQIGIPEAAQSGVVAIAAGGNHSLALKSDGSVLGWGYNGNGETSIPEAASSAVTAIAAGYRHSLALKSDGSLVGWGYNGYGQISIPEAARSGVTAVAAGYYHSLALKSDSSVVGWGYNGHGESSIPLAAQSGAVAIAAGAWHSLAVIDPIFAAITAAERSCTVDMLSLWSGDVPGISQVSGTLAHDGLRALKLSTVDEKSTRLERVVQGPAVVDFWWRASSEKDFDELTFSVDGAVAETISGETAWARKSVTFLGAETHVLRWEYAKDSSDANYDDAGYLDDLVVLEAFGDLKVFDSALQLQGSPTITFDQAEESGTPTSKTLSLRNDGTLPLTLTFHLPEAGAFTMVDGTFSTSVVLERGQSHDLEVLLVTDRPGNMEANLSIIAVDSRNQPSRTQPPLIRFAGNVKGTGPDIMIKRNDQVLSPFSSDPHAFGAAPTELTFTILNIGTDELGDVSVSPEPADKFSVSQAPSQSIPVGGSTTFTIRANDLITGEFSGIIRVLSNDRDSADFPIPVKARYVPQMSVTYGGAAVVNNRPEAFDLGIAPSEMTLVVSNNGTGPLYLGSPQSSQPDDFRFASLPTKVAVGESLPVVLRAKPVRIGSRTGVLSFASNDEDEPLFQIPVRSDVLLALGDDGAVAGSLQNSGTLSGWAAASGVVLPDGGAGMVLKSGNTPNSGDSSVGLVLEGPGVLTWQWRSSTQKDFDWLLCEVNGVEVAGVSEKNGLWRSQAIPIGRSATVRWTYRKDTANASGEDAGYLGPVRFIKFTGAQAKHEGFRAWCLRVGVEDSSSMGRISSLDAWVGGFDPGQVIGPLDYVPRVEAGVFKYRYALSQRAALAFLPMCSRSEDLVTWSGRGFEQRIVEENEQRVVVEVSLASKNRGFIALQKPVRAALSCGSYHSLALEVDGSVLGWGYSGNGQTSVPAAAQNGVVAIAAGGYHSLALKSDGSVVGWGSNGNGETSIPAAAQSGVVAIAAGPNHSLSLKSDGSVVGWGYNVNGQASVPAGAQSGVVAIAAGARHSLALKSDGSVVGWGYRYYWWEASWYGQSSIPEQAQSGVVAIAAGSEHSLALKSDGSVVGWGYNGNGEASIPEQAQSGVVAIAAGGNHSLALKSDGSVVGWGRNWEGQTSIPAAAQDGVVAIAAGHFHSLALKSDGSVVGWGNNGNGQSTIPANLFLWW
jgi:alpha-tubulin suppressor-like RCC1 family protein